MTHLDDDESRRRRFDPCEANAHKQSAASRTGSRHVHWVPFALLVATLPAFAGCTIIGVVGGALINEENYDPGDVKRIPEGAGVTVLLRNNSSRSGKFAGLTEQSEEHAAVLYNQFCEQQRDAILPPWRAELRVRSRRNTVYDGLFVGFGTRDAGSDDYVRLYSSSVGFFNEPLSRIRTIQGADSVAYDVDALRRLVATRQIPLVSAIALDQSGMQVLIPLDQIKSVRRPGTKNAILIGFFIGASIDALIIAIMAASVRDLDFFDNWW